jgi:ribosomal protein S18 acetylase RimI-like enzyme
MTAKEDVVIVDVPAKERAGLEWILEESFEGWYLLHSKRTLRDIEVVRVAKSSGKPIGLVMLKSLEGSTGYVYYIAVAKAHRKKGTAKLLLEDALRRFKASRMQEVFASVEKNNKASEALFESEGFTPTSFSEVSKRHGNLHTLNMYREMLVVPGEVLLRKAMT